MWLPLSISRSVYIRVYIYAIPPRGPCPPPHDEANLQHNYVIAVVNTDDISIFPLSPKGVAVSVTYLSTTTVMQSVAS